MRFAYADPPYLGCAKRLYGDATYDDPEAHRRLIESLCLNYPDGWALSLHAPSLRVILPMCPEDVRVGPYCKTFAQIRRGVGVQWFWEPVIWRGGRIDTGDEHRRDWVAAFPRNAVSDGLIGGKPIEFCRWLFSLLGAQKGDTFDDIFPGTHAVSAAWEWHTKQIPEQLEMS